MRKLLLGVMFGLVMATVGVLAGNGQATAAGCDDYAIMYCGATSPQQFINKINNDGHHTDHKAVYADFGLVPSEYGKFVNSAKQGTLRENGDIVVGGTVVGRSTMNVGRVHDSNFNQRVTINGHEYWGGPFGSTYHANTADVMVMFNDQGVMQFAVINSCGNPQRIVPNRPVASCDNLRNTKVVKNTYRFTTAATATHGAELVKAVYDFGDGQTRTVTTLSQPVEHTFKKDATVRVTVYVRVPGGNIITKSGADCVTQVTFQAPPPPNPHAMCTGLTATLLDQATRNYKFVATAQVSGGAKLKSGDFDFGDNVIMRGLVPNNNKVVVRHAYSQAGTYTVHATLHFTAADGQEATATCDTTLNPTTNECKPGVPVGSPECEEQQQECVPAGKDDDSCELTDTGPGMMIAGIFGGATTIAGVGHYLIRRRLLGL